MGHGFLAKESPNAADSLDALFWQRVLALVSSWETALAFDLQYKSSTMGLSKGTLSSRALRFN